MRMKTGLTKAEGVDADVVAEAAGYRLDMMGSRLVDSAGRVSTWAPASAGKGTIVVNVVVGNDVEAADGGTGVDRRGTYVACVVGEVEELDNSYHAVFCHC